MKIFNFYNEVKMQNNLLNSILKIIYLGNNQKICDLLFNNSSIFNKPDDYRHIISLSYSKILFKFNNMKDNDKYIKIMSNILSQFTLNEMLNCLSDLNQKLFSDYEPINFFLNLLIENFNKLKPLQNIINQKLFDIISLLFDIKKYNKEELLNNECFKEIICKLFLFILNTDGKYNPKNYFDFFQKVKPFLNEFNQNTIFFEIFKIFFIELYDFSQYNKDDEIIVKNQFLNNCKDFHNFVNLKEKALDSILFNYLGNIIQLFTSFIPDIKIINFFENYFNNAFYLYYQIFLSQYNELRNNELKPNENEFILCNFFHLFQSKTICYKFYLYLKKYAQNINNQNIFELFPDFKATLMNTYKLCPSPFYFDILVDFLKDINNHIENLIYFKEIIEVILKIEEVGGNYVYKMDDFNENKYQNYYVNTIQLIKLFYYFSQDSKTCKILYNNKLEVYILELLKKIKKNLYIFSRYLIKLDNDRTQKSILEICFDIIISIFYYSTGIINKELYELFLDDNLKKDNNDTGKSIVFTFDSFNNLFNYKNENKLNIEDYHNSDFENYMYEMKTKKEEKSLLIIFIMKIYLLKKNKNNNNIIDNFYDLLINDLLILMNNSSKLKKTKMDNYYDSFIEMINNTRKNSQIVKKDNIISLLETIILENNIDKKLKLIEDVDYLILLEHDDNYIGHYCLFKTKCLLKQSLSYEHIENLKNTYPEILNSYFDIEMLNVVKCLKKDLLLKDCSIYFNDIYFNDKNFIKIKNSFFYKYKNYLSNDDDSTDKFLNYPTRLKNFASNKYAGPKIFLASNINLYNKEDFSLLYPTINKNLIKNKSFPSLPTHYEYYENLLLNNDVNLILQTYNCELISVKRIILGQIEIYEKYIIFKNKDSYGDYETSIKYIYSNEIKEVSLDKKIIIMNFYEIDEIIRRTFAYNEQVIEIFLKNGKSYLFNLFEEYYLEKFYEKIKEIIGGQDKLNFKLIREPIKEFEKNEYTKQWENNEIDNYQYLLYLNKFSGRTFNDINQYPIFPWVILNEKFNNSSESNINNNEKDNKRLNKNIYSKLFFRDMEYFIMTQTEEGREKAIQEYKSLERESPNKGFHFSLHYSTNGYILLYLMRIIPFMDAHIKFQSGTFDDPNRLINSIDELLSIMKDFKDNRELIPEFFTTIEYFCNLNFIFFGIRYLNKVLINNMNPPSIFNSLSNYLYFNRIFLNNRVEDKNNNIPKCKLYSWINLIFGNKQYPTSLDNLNKFGKYCYRQNIRLPKLYQKYKDKKFSKEIVMKKMIFKVSRVINFGQCPEQIFTTKNKIHIRDSSHFISLSNRINEYYEFKNNNIKIITFWISENQSYIYFLTKNKINKNMSILIYDEKFNKKSEIFIDKIKLFNEKNDYNKKQKEKINNELFSHELQKTENLKKKLKSKTFDDYDFFSFKEKRSSFQYFNDESELYILNPKDAIIDISNCDSIYFFIGRNKDNSLKIYEENKNNGTFIGLIKTDSFISVLHKKDNETFFTGHKNGKLIEWKIKYKEINTYISKIIQFKNKTKKIIDNIIFKREILAHNFNMITSINYCQKHNIILTSDTKGFLYIRKYYDFEFLTKIQINEKLDSTFINKIYINNYDIICTINYNKLKSNNYICFYSLNGLLLEKSNNYLCGDTSLLKNGKIIFNCFNTNNLFIFGFNGNDKKTKIGTIIEDNILCNLDIKKNFDSIKNFTIENNNIYILLKNGKFIKGYYNKLDSLLYGIDLSKFSQ